jgi:hypothetical protein
MIDVAWRPMASYRLKLIKNTKRIYQNRKQVLESVTQGTYIQLLANICLALPRLKAVSHNVLTKSSKNPNAREDARCR